MNRIDKLIAVGIKNPEDFEKQLSEMEAFSDNGELYKEFKESLDRKGEEIRQLSIRKQLEPILDIVSLSYIAKNYFSKSRQWLNHRLNGNKVNGSTVEFTHEQLEILQNALTDISKKISQISVVR